MLNDGSSDLGASTRPHRAYSDASGSARASVSAGTQVSASTCMRWSNGQRQREGPCQHRAAGTTLHARLPAAPAASLQASGRFAGADKLPGRNGRAQHRPGLMSRIPGRITALADARPAFVWTPRLRPVASTDHGGDTEPATIRGEASRSNIQ